MTEDEFIDLIQFHGSASAVFDTGLTPEDCAPGPLRGIITNIYNTRNLIPMLENNVRDHIAWKEYVKK